MFWFFGLESCGILAPQPGIKPTPTAFEGSLNYRTTKKSPKVYYLKSPGLWQFVTAATGNWLAPKDRSISQEIATELLFSMPAPRVTMGHSQTCLALQVSSKSHPLW